jgi:hypothetical protein
MRAGPRACQDARDALRSRPVDLSSAQAAAVVEAGVASLGDLDRRVAAPLGRWGLGEIERLVAL